MFVALFLSHVLLDSQYPDEFDNVSCVVAS